MTTCDVPTNGTVPAGTMPPSMEAPAPTPGRILVAAELPGLLAALEPSYGSQVMVLRDAEAIDSWLAQHRVQALLLDDTITPYPHDPAGGPGSSDAPDIPASLWYVVQRAQARNVPTILILREGTMPPLIRDSLTAAVQATGSPGRAGVAHVVSPTARASLVPQLVQQVRQYVPIRTAQRILLPLGRGGTGKSTQGAQLLAALQQRNPTLRLLVVDADFANGSMADWFKVPRGTFEPLMSLRDEFPNRLDRYPADAVQRRIVHHESGIDLLLSGHGLAEVKDMSRGAMEALFATLPELPYDVVWVDMGPDQKARPYLSAVVAQQGRVLVLCPASKKGQNGARDSLEVLRRIAPPGQNATMLTDHTALVYIQPPVGHILSAPAKFREVQERMRQQYPEVRHLGALPYDAWLISTIEEEVRFLTVYDVDARGAYARAMDTVAQQVQDWLQLPLPPGSSGIPSAATAPPRRPGGGLRGLWQRLRGQGGAR